MKLVIDTNVIIAAFATREFWNLLKRKKNDL